MQSKMVSILVPMYNEEEVADIFFNAIIPILDALPVAWEIVCVNDGSKDGTLDILARWNAAEQRIKIVNLSRNFGKESALTAALDYSSGDAVIPVDADMQDPPSVIPELVDAWLNGFDIVNAVRACRSSDALMKRFTARWFYMLMNSISESPVPPDVGDFRLISRRACDSITSLRERRRFMKGLFSWVGFPTTTVTYRRMSRAAGVTKWNYWKLWNFAIEGITSFSTAPLKIATYLGLFAALVGLSYAVVLVLGTLLFGNPVKGYASLMTAVLFFGGVQLIFIGIVGEYVGRIYDEVKGRPIYIVESDRGFEG